MTTKAIKIDERVEQKNIVYTPTPTALKFHQDDTRIRLIMGPIGSGKSVASVMELFDRARRQNISPDGVRRSRWAIIRNTYPELKSTTIKTFEEWIPPEICRIKYDSPITGRVYTVLPDKTIMDMEIYFIAIDQPKDVKKLLSLELTGAWINEAREVSKHLLDMLFGRTARFPGKRLGGSAWTGVILDTNPCDDDHWIYKLAEETMPKGFSFYRQPAAIIFNKTTGEWEGNPDAENVENHDLGINYWLDQVHGKDENFVKVYLEGKYGTIEDGKPIYSEFSREHHVSKIEVPVMKNRPLIIGFDFGRTPACVIKQVSPNGIIHTLKEIVTPNDQSRGLETFLKDIVIPYLNIAFTEWKLEEILVPIDPAGMNKPESNERACFDILGACGFRNTLPAKTNKPTLRIEAVKRPLNRMVDGSPAYLINPSCKVLIKGFNGGYKYGRIAVSGQERYTDKPLKNHFSHVHDANQYADLYIAGGGGSESRAIRQEVAIQEYDHYNQSDAQQFGRRPTQLEEHNPFK